MHVPFCTRRCDYCAFATWDDRDQLIPTYVAGVIEEIKAATSAGLPGATSVFFGGGTPSLLSGEQMAAILAEVLLNEGTEVTVECNPDNVTVDLLRGYRQAGVNRISLGVQSMVPHVLLALGRLHDIENVQAAVEAIGEVGFDSFNIDLIYGTVGESIDDWRTTLHAARALNPPHVSAYGLTVEAGTALAEDLSRAPDDDDQADKYHLADDLFSDVGLRNYEISNWARPGHECRHNFLYWNQGDYRGFGCAAHSHNKGRRWWNVRTPERYLAILRAGDSVEAGFEVLDESARLLEGLQLGLRTRSGVPRSALSDSDIGVGGALEGLVEPDGDRLVLTRRGRLLANEVALALRSPGWIGRDR